jgi:hypothetical protein
LTSRPNRAILKGDKKRAMFFVAQRQPHNDEVEILWECTSEQQAEDACERLNSNLALAGIPGEYYAYVL